MKKFLAIGLVTVASLALIGCQQQQPKSQTQTTSQTETSKASIQITEGETATSKASLQIMPSTEETSGASDSNKMGVTVSSSQEESADAKVADDKKVN